MIGRYLTTVLVWALFTVGCVLTSVTGVTYGHPGRTAADGCHFDRSTGIRHCHNKKPTPPPTPAPAPVPAPAPTPEPAPAPAPQVLALKQYSMFGEVIAIYGFEDTTDSGPREFDGELSGNASIVNTGKIGKSLEIRDTGKFSMRDNRFLGIGGGFSIVAWVKLPVQAYPFNMTAIGKNDNGRNAGAIRLSIRTSGNIRGLHVDYEDDKSQSIESDHRNVADNKWHHIAYTQYGGTSDGRYNLFIDGEIVKRSETEGYFGFVGDETLISISGSPGDAVRGTVRVDEVGFFETGFSVYEIEGLYDDGLTDFLEAMPVDPRQRVATTWGALKRQ